ncbi:YcaO-like family protein [Devosia equisanguinis]|uniref:YcaO-like family protein n=1 Tax=Devosia equisanguinis TaxID=2490941 RepID=A0A447ICS3_9HYPH|nr:YcaO-like family protein [Devosia equisanguinis]VDS05277.1 YcaO-like family protein [Devosia equisanguinis]
MQHPGYHDRVCSPEQTLATIGPHLGRYGITRLARQTSLDLLGIPVFAAIRPNAMTLATSQGKGLTDAAAKASAAMEALEYAIAERPECPMRIAAAEELQAAGFALHLSTATLPLGATFPLDRPITWLEGSSLFGGETVLVPLDLVALRGAASDLPGICQHTNGLASGNSVEEALFHGLCELVERDAGSFWALMPLADRDNRRLDPAVFGDPEVKRLAKAVADAGLVLRLYDQTSDLAIPTIMAEIGPAGTHASQRHQLSSGSGTHPVAARAALRAITEAAQSRVTAIAAARDDMPPELYAGMALQPEQGDRPTRAAPAGLTLGTPLAELLDHMLQTLFAHGIDRLIAVPLGGEVAGVAVMKILSDQLEDVGVNLHWRPGPRALAFLAELAA